MPGAGGLSVQTKKTLQLTRFERRAKSDNFWLLKVHAHLFFARCPLAPLGQTLRRIARSASCRIMGLPGGT